MTWVKVCGVRRRQDVEAAVEAGADAIGLVLASSPRQVDLETATQLAALSPVLSVLVTVDVQPDRLLAAAARIGSAGVQPHGMHNREAARAAARAGLFVLEPIRVRDRVPDLGAVPPEHVPLLDAYRAESEGGSGHRFDWALLPEGERPFVLAGGLSPENIGEAVGTIRPWGVDASSGLESSPGVKDAARIKAFVEGAKA